MSLISNIYPIEFDFEEFTIQRIKWDDGLLDKLRQKHNKTHSFFRNEEYIYISSGVENAEQIGEMVLLKIEENFKIVNSLIKHIFFRSFKNRFPEIKPTFYPFSFPSRKSQHDLIIDFLPDDDSRKILSYRKFNDIYIRPTSIQGQKRFNIIIDSSYKWSLNVSCEFLAKNNFDITGLEVGRYVKYDLGDDVLAPNLELLGIIVNFENGNATVNTNDGEQVFPLSNLYLNKSYDNIKFYLEHKYGQAKAIEILNNTRKRQFERNDPTTTTKEIAEIAKVLCGLSYKNFDGFYFKINSDSSPEYESLDLIEPTYLFDVSLTKIDSAPSRGLNNYGPYDYGKFFDISRPRVLVVCHKGSSGGFSQFLAQLKDGIQGSPYFSKGFLAKYRLQSIEFILKEISDYNSSTYLEVIKKAIVESEETYDIALVETREDFKSLPVVTNPYFISKAYLLSMGIPVQFLKIENARKPDFIIDSCALQMYAKMGGVPWTLPASKTIAHEIIVGIGSSIVRENKFAGASQNRIVGITTFFTSDGQYLLSNKSKEVKYDEYFNELLKNLKTSIDKISSEQGWNKNDIVRIVFHVFKPMKNLEVEVVSVLIQQYPDFNIKFAFLSFGEHHPILFFDLNQLGKASRYGSFTKGKYMPKRGLNYILDEGVCVLQLKGPNQIISDKQGFIGPLLIKVHPKSSFMDLNYLVQQVYRLTNISYRTFTPSQLPVTLFYASLIADQLNKLSQIPNWSSDSLKNLRNKKWFI